MKNKSISTKMRVIHRYLGFFLAGIMAMYALSGIVLIFRNTDFLQETKTLEKHLGANLAVQQLGEQLRIRGFSATGEDANTISFKEGTYDKNTGVATYSMKSLPLVLDKMTQIHKATTNSPLFILNIFFGASLLFFVISTFWMFTPKSSIFVKGLYFTAGGVVLTLIMLFL